MKKTAKRLPLPKKPPKVEPPKTAYDRKQAKKDARREVARLDSRK